MARCYTITAPVAVVAVAADILAVVQEGRVPIRHPAAAAAAAPLLPVR